MSLSHEELREIVVELARRPGHEKVRVAIHDILVRGLGAPRSEIDFERPLPEVHGRADALWSRTVFEFKRDLRREKRDAEEELTRYLADRERETGDHFVGIATDGARYIPYELRGGELVELTGFTLTSERPRDLIGWLGSTAAVSDALAPDAETVDIELGRGSLAWQIAGAELRALWEKVSDRPDVRLKRDLWARLLSAYTARRLTATRSFSSTPI